MKEMRDSSLLEKKKNKSSKCDEMFTLLIFFLEKFKKIFKISCIEVLKCHIIKSHDFFRSIISVLKSSIFRMTILQPF